MRIGTSKWLSAAVAGGMVILSSGCLMRKVKPLDAANPMRIIHRHRVAGLNVPVKPNEQPDKILYDKSMSEIAHGRYDVGRLTLQTLLNTYPDSEYLAKAKLAIADSYYRQGGVSGLTQAEAEYKDFETFFPTAPEAPMAQYRAGMAHFKLMGKPNRDLTEAKLAEIEFEEFLKTYPDDPLMPRVKGRLREVQEVLAEGEFEVAEFYYAHQANPAARSRFEAIVNEYPSFSQADQVCWDLAQTLDRLKKPAEAVPYYDRIITDYPLSPLVPDAKRELAALHQPIPEPTKAELAVAEANRADRVHRGLLKQVGGVFSSAPDLSATRHGPVLLGQQPGETEMAKNPAPAASGNTIAVQPVGEEALKTGNAQDPKSKAANGQKAANGAPASSTDKSADTAPPPVQKKHRSLLKHILKPW